MARKPNKQHSEVLRSLKLTVTAWRHYRQGLASLETALGARPRDLQFFVQALAESSSKPTQGHVAILLTQPKERKD